MNVIAPSKGTTSSERYLAKLAERTFLNLWAYPNVFNDKKVHAKGDGKELCDLLVVCGDHVLIFSDKTIAWPGGDDVQLAWRRWFKRAIGKSAEQIRGAQRWLDKFPDRVFLDAKCTQRLPLRLPPSERRKVHGIVVALGAGNACKRFFKGGIGSLVVRPDIKGDHHIVDNIGNPFAIGDVDPSGSFIHVFDDATLDIVMSEMDTVTDLTDYLTKKEALIRSGGLVGAPGEEELIAYYMTHMNAAQEHDFTRPDGSAWGNEDAFTIGSGHYSKLLSHPQYVAKRQADEGSYIWDRLIEAFTNHMLAGTTVVPEGDAFDLAEYEQGLRHMALVPRHLRRVYGHGIIDLLQRGASADRLTRAFLPLPTAVENGTAFFFMTLAVPRRELAGGYEQYRQVRRNMLETYALTLLRKYPNLKRIVGIATEPRKGPGEETESSEDLIYGEPPEWSPEVVKDLEERQKIFDIAREGRYKEYAFRGREFPDVQTGDEGLRAAPKLNRRQRRAVEARARKQKR